MTFSNERVKKKKRQAAMEAINMLSSQISAVFCMNLHTFDYVHECDR